MEQIVVTRHQALHDYLINRGLVRPGTKRIVHATEDDVRGRHVIGHLPYHLAVLADRVTVVSVLVPHAERGAALSMDQVERYVGNIRAYQVQAL